MLPWGDASDMMRHQSGKGGCNKTSGEEVFNMGGSNEGSKTIRGAVGGTSFQQMLLGELGGHM